MEDVSATGAKLTVEGSIEGLHLKEFFLLLSSTGLAYRRCELVWVNGNQIGARFIALGPRKMRRDDLQPLRPTPERTSPDRTYSEQLQRHFRVWH